jgi:hypothetical protein
MRSAPRLLLTLTLVAAPAALPAATVIETDIRHDHGTYTVKFDVRVNGDAGRIRTLFTDYRHEYDLSDTIVERKLLHTNGDGSVRVRIVMRGCVLIFCQTAKKVMDVQFPNGSEVLAQIDPHESDFRLGRERWRFLAEGETTRIQYDAELVPDFFIPPLIGPWLIKRRMAEELEASAVRIEALARTNEPPSWYGPAP